MGKHAIIVIKNNENKYLQYFDKDWNSLLFMNAKLKDDHNDEKIKKYISEKLSINIESIECRYIDKRIHTKFSEREKIEKEYEHYFYNVEIKNIEGKNFVIDDIEYTWHTYDNLINNERVYKVNSDILGFIKELDL